MAMQFPRWINDLPQDEKNSARAVWLFLYLDKKQYQVSDDLLDLFAKVVEDANWPDDGTFPPMSKEVEKKLGTHKKKWHSWHKDSVKRRFWHIVSLCLKKSA